LAVLGAVLLQLPGAVEVSGRDRVAYGALTVWQAGFDSLSAACGCGLLTRDLDDDYGAPGRWLLLGIGVGGAVLFMAAGWQTARRLCGGRGLPRFRVVVGAFAGLQVLSIAGAWVNAIYRSSEPAGGDAAWNAIATGCSLGWLREVEREALWLFGLLSLLVAVGWPVWLMVIGRVRRVAGVWAFAVFAILATVAVSALETPRGGRDGGSGGDRLADCAVLERVGRAGLQILCASGAGTETEPIADRGLSEGTKAVLAGVVLAGGLGGSPGGGIKWVLLAVLLGAVGAWRQRHGNAKLYSRSAYITVGLSCVVMMAGLTVVVAVGLLVLEGLSGAAFRAPPTFADALLDAASAVGGANLSSGVTEVVTSANLSRGVRLGVDYYQYGMVVLMLAMLAGRILPVLVLNRAVGLLSREAPIEMPPPL
jgi:hypothetical protein